MSVLNFIEINWALFLILAAMCIMLGTDAHLPKNVNAIFMCIVIAVLALAIVDYFETALWDGGYSVWRTVLTALKYSISPIIIALVVMTVYQKNRLVLLLPSAVNLAVCVASIFTGLVFNIDSANMFHRGPVWFFPFIVAFAYVAFLIYLLHKMVKSGNAMREDYVLNIFIILLTLLNFCFPIVWGDQFQHWFATTIAIGVFVYYCFLTRRLTHKDALTGLLNRHCYYVDLEKSPNDISALVSIDMNGLKRINDECTHQEGDRALAALADCFTKAAYPSQRVYRVGGDEFMIICHNTAPAEVEDLARRIRDNVKRTKYSCAVGYCCREYGMSLDEVFRIADERMYEEKEEYHRQEALRSQCAPS